MGASLRYFTASLAFVLLSLNLPLSYSNLPVPFRQGDNISPHRGGVPCLSFRTSRPAASYAQFPVCFQPLDIRFEEAEIKSFTNGTGFLDGITHIIVAARISARSVMKSVVESSQRKPR